MIEVDIDEPTIINPSGKKFRLSEQEYYRPFCLENQVAIVPPIIIYTDSDIRKTVFPKVSSTWEIEFYGESNDKW
jgi:hypothetical protein